MTISENGISFFGSGGHSHNGINSTIIDVGSYSLFDFSLGYVGSQSRINRQNVNQTAMEEWVIRIVNSKVLTPAGLNLAPDTLSGKSIRANTITATQIQANTITADEIAANTITSNELSSNIVLINNIIRSNNYDGTIAANGIITGQGTAGWAITHAGSAEFSSASIRGAITANSVSTPGIDILSNGAIVSTNFNVTPEGNLSATNASLTGTVSSTSGSIGGWTISSIGISAGSTNLYSNGVLSIGSSASIGSNANIGANATIEDNLFIKNFVRVNGPDPSNVTVMKIRGFVNRGNSLANNRWTLVLESPNGENKWEVRDDGLMQYWTQAAYSDIRVKENVDHSNLGLDFINDLKPRSFNLKLGNDEDGVEVLKETKTYGFVAQEVRESYEKFTDSFDGWALSTPSDPDSLQTISYDNFISPIVKAIQELSNKVDNLEARLQALEDV